MKRSIVTLFAAAAVSMAVSLAAQVPQAAPPAAPQTPPNVRDDPDLRDYRPRHYARPTREAVKLAKRFLAGTNGHEFYVKFTNWFYDDVMSGALADIAYKWTRSGLVAP